MKMEMTRRAFLQVTATILIMPKLSFASEPVRKISLPILLYHDISYEVTDDYTVSPRVFALQMEWLYNNGYRAISLADLESNTLPDRPILITFDDGYASFIPYALPFLQTYGFKATINIIGQYIGTYLTERINRPMLSWDEYRYLASTGLISLGCHTDRLHSYYNTGVLGVSGSSLLEDLERFQDNFTKQMGAPSNIIAWPYGFYNEKSMTIAQKAGFRYMLTSKKGAYRELGNTMEIPRNNVTNNDRLSEFLPKIEVK